MPFSIPSFVLRRSVRRSVRRSFSSSSPISKYRHCSYLSSTPLDSRVLIHQTLTKNLSWISTPFASSKALNANKLQHTSPFVTFREFCTYEPQASEGLIPAELLTSKTVLSPDRTIGQYADLVTRMTNFQNEDKGLLVLDGDVFDVPIRKDIIHRVVRWQLAKRQQGTHSTKTISEVSGTGRKPYKQKGTGRARHGTLRGPQFRGGAVMHGPKPRSHAFKLNKKVRRLGLKIALSARAAEGKLLVFENLEVPNHKTKNIVNYVSQMENTKKVLLVDGGPLNDNLKLATGNLHYVNVLPSIGLNVYSILQHDTLVMTRDAIDRIVTRMHTPINR